ncbi:MAG: hypothetical protein R3Y13_00180 [bacterium]
MFTMSNTDILCLMLFIMFIYVIISLPFVMLFGTLKAFLIQKHGEQKKYNIIEYVFYFIICFLLMYLSVLDSFYMFDGINNIILLLIIIVSHKFSISLQKYIIAMGLKKEAFNISRLYIKLFLIYSFIFNYMLSNRTVNMHVSFLCSIVLLIELSFVIIIYNTTCYMMLKKLKNKNNKLIDRS